MELDLTTPSVGNAPLSRSRKEKAARLLSNGFQNIPWRRLALASAIGLAIYGIVTHPPVRSVANGEVGLRINQWTGSFTRFQDGLAPVVPLIHGFRTYSLRDRVYQPGSDGESSFSFQ